MKKKLGLRTKIIFLFLIVTGVIIGTFFLMNILFWNVIHPNENRAVMRNAYKEMAEMVREGRTSAEELSERMSSLQSGNEICFALSGVDNWDFTFVTEQLVAPVTLAFLNVRMKENFMSLPGEDTRILERKEAYTMQEVDLAGGESYLECYGYMTDREENPRKFLISMTLTYERVTSRVAMGFFIYLSLFSLLMGVILTIYISGKVTKPIEQLSDLSSRMKNLDFSARYEGLQEDEIGVLGNNMNEMSSQLEQSFKELQEANEKLSEDLKKIERVDEMRRDFISDVSHELKTPVALIQGYAEALKEMKDDPEAFEEYRSVILDESGKMDRMVRKLTTLSQLEYGAADYQPEPFDIVEMVRSVLAKSAIALKEAGAKTFVEGPEELEVFGDPFEIDEVLQNYLSNALHHLEDPKEIRFTIEEGAENVRVTVENTGKPIPEEEFDNLWIKFYKVDRARTRAYGGSGIGLSIVKAIMDTHKKACGVRNTERGVAFWFELGRKNERD